MTRHATYSASTTNKTFHMKRKLNLDVKNLVSSKGLISAKKKPAGPSGDAEFCLSNVKYSKALISSSSNVGATWIPYHPSHHLNPWLFDYFDYF